MTLYRLTYSSVPTPDLASWELDSLVAHAATRNRILNVTGALLVSRGSYIQTLEGPSAVLHRLYEQIEADTRHRNVVLVRSGYHRDRLYPEWAMVQLDAPQSDDAGMVEAAR